MTCRKLLLGCAAVLALSGAVARAAPLKPVGGAPPIPLSARTTGAPHGAKAATSAGSYSVNGLEPTVYQTNFWYDGAVINPPSVPTGATITNVSWQWAFNSNPAGVTWEAEICNNTQCGFTTAFNGSSSTFWTGEGALQQWQFGFNATSATTAQIPNGPINGPPSTVNVTYSY